MKGEGFEESSLQLWIVPLDPAVHRDLGWHRWDTRSQSGSRNYSESGIHIKYVFWIIYHYHLL